MGSTGPDGFAAQSPAVRPFDLAILTYAVTDRPAGGVAICHGHGPNSAPLHCSRRREAHLYAYGRRAEDLRVDRISNDIECRRREMMDILVVDDEPLFRAGVNCLLSQVPGLRIVGEAADGRSAFALLDNLQPDIVLLDIALPGMDGFAAVREVRRRAPRTKIVVLSGRKNERDVLEALTAGASGYVTKTNSVEDLLDTLWAVARGETHVSQRLRSTLLAHGALPADVLGPLSTREREVFALLVKGLAVEEIGRELCISPKTVGTHRHRIYEKTGCHTLAALVRFASRNGLLDELTRLGNVAPRARELHPAS